MHLSEAWWPQCMVLSHSLSVSLCTFWLVQWQHLLTVYLCTPGHSFLLPESFLLWSECQAVPNGPFLRARASPVLWRTVGTDTLQVIISMCTNACVCACAYVHLLCTCLTLCSTVLAVNPPPLCLPAQQLYRHWKVDRHINYIEFLFVIVHSNASIWELSRAQKFSMDRLGQGCMQSIKLTSTALFSSFS